MGHLSEAHEGRPADQAHSPVRAGTHTSPQPAVASLRRFGRRRRSLQTPAEAGGRPPRWLHLRAAFLVAAAPPSGGPAPRPPHTVPREFPPLRSNIIRLAPPLIINEEQLREATGIIKKVFQSL